jgi:tetratricopeptide (TPR) repeat protein
MNARVPLVLFACAALALAPNLAFAQDDVGQAKALFNAGAQAYDATRYHDAVQSFEAAYKKAPRPAILFSLAQAYRRLYAVEQKPEHLAAAIANYRRYLADVPQGGRRADAAAALSELVVIAAPLSAGALPAVGSTEPPAAKTRTRLNVTSPTAGARASLDGGAPVDVPLMAEVSPGKHKITITAPGYIDEQREIVAVEGDMTALDRELQEMPAVLLLNAPAGALVTLDGRLVGTTPLPPLNVASGQRFVAITKNGYRPFSRDFSLKRGQRVTLSVDLSRTLQRKLAYGAGVGAALAAVGGLVATYVAIEQHREAVAIWNERQRQAIDEQRLDAFQQHLDKRDQAAAAMIISFGTTGIFGLAGFMLFAYDTPSPPAPPLRGDEFKPTRPERPTMDLAVAPLLGPGLGGAAIGGRF